MRPISLFIRPFVTDRSGMSALNLAAGFAFAAILAGVLGAPLAKYLSPETRTRIAIQNSGPVDRVVTGSVERSTEAKRYTIRRSVLNDSSSQACIIHENGAREGAC